MFQRGSNHQPGTYCFTDGFTQLYLTTVLSRQLPRFHCLRCEVRKAPGGDGGPNRGWTSTGCQRWRVPGNLGETAAKYGIRTDKTHLCVVFFGHLGIYIYIHINICVCFFSCFCWSCFSLLEYIIEINPIYIYICICIYLYIYIIHTMHLDSNNVTATSLEWLIRRLRFKWVLICFYFNVF